MKSKLVKYPFNDGKRYRWDKYQMGKQFEYTWEQSRLPNYDTLVPCIEAHTVNTSNSSIYGYTDISSNNAASSYSNDVAYSYSPTTTNIIKKEIDRSLVYDVRLRRNIYFYIRENTGIAGLGYFGIFNGNVYPYTSTDPEVTYAQGQTHFNTWVQEQTIPQASNGLYYSEAERLYYGGEYGQAEGPWYNLIELVSIGGTKYTIDFRTSTYPGYQILNLNELRSYTYRELCQIALTQVYGAAETAKIMDTSTDLTGFSYDLYRNYLQYYRPGEHNTEVFTGAYHNISLETYVAKNNNINVGLYDTLDNYYIEHRVNVSDIPLNNETLLKSVLFYTDEGQSYTTNSNMGLNSNEFNYLYRTAHVSFEYWANVFGKYQGGIFGQYWYNSRDAYYNTNIPSLNEWSVSNTGFITNFGRSRCSFTELRPTDTYIVPYYANYRYYYYTNKTSVNKTDDAYQLWNVSVDVSNKPTLTTIITSTYMNNNNSFIAPVSRLTYNDVYIELSQNSFYMLGKKNGAYLADNVTTTANGIVRLTNYCSYSIGTIENNAFVPKTVQRNQPSTYLNGVVDTSVPLAYNSYSLNDWNNGFHFTTSGWNSLISPFGYANNINVDTNDRQFSVEYEVVNETITVLPIFDNLGKDLVINDSNGNSYTYTKQNLNSAFNSFVGGLVDFVGDTVTSYNRHQYPDNGSQDGRAYMLRPELTKFIKYTESTDITLEIVLNKDRYYLTHNKTYFNRDTSLYNTVIGTTQSTNEESIPDAQWRAYLGLYMGESIPFLGIIEQNIPDSEILGVPEYDKQINTSETLKYGTIASASLTFVLNKPVDEAMEHNSDYLILYYDFENKNDWKRFGFFYVDSVESIDENTSRITAHDEAYKLNKYVDDFLENYGNASTLKKFYTDLLDFCGCYYDSQNNPVNYGHLTLDNIYHAVKTTGTEVAHYIATISTGFIHANVDGDIVISTYSYTNSTYTPDKYADLQYSAYDADVVDKVKITINNVVVGESDANGANAYYLEDNPLISSTWEPAKLKDLANDSCSKYTTLPKYRPATIKFLTYPIPTIYMGTLNYVKTLKDELYYFAVMRMSVDGSGMTIQSFGTQTYPVEQSTTGQFVNLINNLDSVDSDVSNLERASELLGQRIQNVEDDVETLQTNLSNADSSISSLTTRMGNAENNISAISTNLQNKINNDSISQSNNLVSIKINGTTKNNITNKDYVDNAISNQIAEKNSISSANDLVTAMINSTTVTDIATKAYVDNNAGIGENGAVFQKCRVSFDNNNYSCYYIGQNTRLGMWTGIILPGLFYGYFHYGGYVLFGVDNGNLYGLKQSDMSWWRISSGTVTYGW